MVITFTPSIKIEFLDKLILEKGNTLVTCIRAVNLGPKIKSPVRVFLHGDNLRFQPHCLYIDRQKPTSVPITISCTSRCPFGKREITVVAHDEEGSDITRRVEIDIVRHIRPAPAPKQKKKKNWNPLPKFYSLFLNKHFKKTPNPMEEPECGLAEIGGGILEKDSPILSFNQNKTPFGTPNSKSKSGHLKHKRGAESPKDETNDSYTKKRNPSLRLLGPLQMEADSFESASSEGLSGYLVPVGDLDWEQCIE